MTETDAEMALEELFKRDSALKGGAAPVPETDAFRAFVYASPEAKAAQKAGAEKPPLPPVLSPTPDKIPQTAGQLLDSAYQDFIAGKTPEYKEKMAQVDTILKENLKEKGIAGVYSPVKVAPLKAGVTRRNTTTGGDIVTSLLTIRNQVKLYHWQTGSFARHKATDDLTAALDTSIDNFVEVYMGRYGRPKVSKTIKLSNYSEAEAQRFVSKQRKFLSEVLPRKIKKSDTDLLNIRDEILGELNKVLYLFTLA